jgi:hypothetical protein
MSAALIAQLIAAFGPAAIQLITQLIALIETNTNVTSAQWQTLIAGIEASTATTEMAKQLKTAGIAPTDPRYIALIAETQPKAPVAPVTFPATAQ